MGGGSMYGGGMDVLVSARQCVASLGLSLLLL
jgi:hypothetical protein